MDLTAKKNIYFLSLGLSAPVTLSLFYLMANLISQPAKLGKSDENLNYMDFIRNVNELRPETRKRVIPKKPPKAKPPPQRPKLSVAQSKEVKAEINRIPLMESPAFGEGLFLGGGSLGDQNSDRDEMPLVRIEPQYPRQAAIAGKEGWVRLSFDVNELGEVNKVKVISSNPRRLFDQAAKRAVYKWKYRPKIVDGKAVKRTGLIIQLDFKLEDERQ